MKPIPVASFAGVLLWLISAVGLWGAADDHAALEARQSEFVAAMSAKDADRLVEFFADGALLHIANQPPVQGREAIHSFYAQVFRFLKAASSEPEMVQVAAAGDLAYATHRVVNVFDRQGATLEYNGKSLIVWERRDGVWKVAVYAVSNNRSEPLAR
jgi:uncharacterized protein (TIGR02246 family)